MKLVARPHGLAACVLLVASSLLAAPTIPLKRPLSHRDYDAWRSIDREVLSRDGRYLAYAYMPQDGDGEVIVRDLKTAKEWRMDVGALPQPLPQAVDEANPDET